jgi:outer membrane murein-binding lipoprotein Lpp
MVKGVAVVMSLAGVLLFVRPTTQSDTDAVRRVLQIKIETVEKKVDRLSQQVQILNEKIDKLNRGVTALEKILITDEEGGKTKESTDASTLSNRNKPAE